MTEAVLELVVAPIAYAVLVGIAFAPLEHLVPLVRRSPWRAGIGRDLLYATIGAVAANLAAFFVLGVSLSALEPHALATPRVLLDQPALAIAAGVLVIEVMGYAYHRLAHAVPWLYRLHAVHHSSEKLDWLASFRQHPVEIALMTLFQTVPVVLLGIPLELHVVVTALLKINTVFVHSNLAFPSLGLLLATPRFHHRHHDESLPVANYASLLPAIDWLFGTRDAGPPRAR